MEVKKMNQAYQKFLNSLKNKKIAIVGIGVSNLPLIQILKELNCDITLFDSKELNTMKEEIQELIKNSKIKTSFGEHYLEKLTGFDIIFRSPSFLPTNPYLVKEKIRGAYITTEVEQVIKLAPCQIIGITGSKGKTTTTTILANILEKLGYRVHLGGNIGTPLFKELDKMKETDIVVLELSSFQLMNMEVSPNIAIITNISPDHLDIHGSYEEYIDAKKYIFKNQTKDGILVLNADDEIVSTFEKDANGKVRYFGSKEQKDTYYLKEDFICYQDEKIIDTKILRLKGRHNYLNICAALNAIKDKITVSNQELESIIKEIKSVHHRLEFVREINGVEWYNDSASTTPDKSLAGIYAFDKKIVLIAGGYDKNISYEPMAKPILERVSKLILFGNTKNKIYDAVMNLKKKSGGDIQIYVMDTLEEVVSVAYEVSTKEEVVLFSPASASFDMFQNAYQRGDLFKEKVNHLGE